MANINDLPTLMEEVSRRLYEGFFKEKDKAILSALMDKGFPTDEVFIKENMECVTYEEETEFEHYWYHFGQPDAVKVISFEREPRFELVQPNDPIKNNFKQTVEAKYY